MEDPSEGMLGLRDVLTLSLANEYRMFTFDSGRFPQSWPTSHVIETQLKLPHVAARRATEALEIARNFYGNEETFTESSFEPLKNLRDKVKKRLRRFFDEK